MDEQDLIHRMRRGEQRAFDLFFEAYAARLVAFAARRSALDAAALEDVVQMTMINAMRGLAGFRGGSSLFTWLCQICRNHLADAMKDLDLLLTPSAPGEAPAGLASTGDTSFNILSTWTYTPCLTLPVFTGPSGLPVGIQLIGHRNQDHRMLEGAQAVYRVFSKST